MYIVTLTPPQSRFRIFLSSPKFPSGSFVERATDLFCLYGFAFPRMLYTWNRMVCSLVSVFFYLA